MTSPTLFKRMTLALLRSIDSRRARGQEGQTSEEAAITGRLQGVEAVKVELTAFANGPRIAQARGK